MLKEKIFVSRSEVVDLKDLLLARQIVFLFYLLLFSSFKCIFQSYEKKCLKNCTITNPIIIGSKQQSLDALLK